jgi:hypothetical protein
MIDLLGVPTPPQPQQGSVLYIADRWPFRATVCALANGSTWATLSSGGFVVYEWPAAPITPAELAPQIDATAKAIFQQCAWYQQSSA